MKLDPFPLKSAASQGLCSEEIEQSRGTGLSVVSVNAADRKRPAHSAAAHHRVYAAHMKRVSSTGDHGNIVDEENREMLQPHLCPRKAVGSRDQSDFTQQPNPGFN